MDLGIGQALTYHVKPAFSGAAVDFLGLNNVALRPRNSGGLPQSFSVGAGWLWPQVYRLESPYFPFVSIGLSYQHTNLFNTKKSVVYWFEEALPDGEKAAQPFAVAPYTFSQDSVMANLKLDLYRWRYVMPYLSLGLGAAWNQVKDKAVFTAVDGEQVRGQITDANSRNTAFSYSAGLGLDFPVTEKFWLSLGYAYSGLGRMGGINSLTNSVDPNPTNPLDIILNHVSSFGQVSTQTILLMGRYVFA
ncbi:uncharacterized protein RVIR1_03040 [Candidatus Rickettsiella viridis]|uniref:Outer membrane protein beta-barrel domain-containing protein n=1 Tax=Candidatus Rickettsiella viridis TaxID=676208 RepID=A0A2Z5V6X2_9COXI|nr:uncharacterized protein RVIR1_03040 [Candidatus Rickettsiella viridis]